MSIAPKPIRSTPSLTAGLSSPCKYLRSWLCGLSFLVFAVASDGAEIAAGAADPLNGLVPSHPRLLISADTPAQLLAAARADSLQAALHARVISLAETHLDAPPLVHRLVGPRLLPQSRAAIERVLACSLAYRLTTDRRFLERAKHDLLTAAAFPDWNPSHFLDVAEMSFAVSIGYDWLYADLTSAERATLKRALLDKALVFATGAYGTEKPTDDRLWWPTNGSNWNQVCNGGMLAAALALADEEPAVARTVVNGVRRSLTYAVPVYHPDGAYPEGPQYWDYGTTYHVLAVAMLASALGNAFGLDADPAFQRTVRYRLAIEGPTGLAFNYADCTPQCELPPAFAWLAARFAEPQALAHREAVLTTRAKLPLSARPIDRFLPLHAVWRACPPRAGGATSSSALPLDLHFRGAADIALFRSAWNDPDAVFVGLKAGDSRAPHGHLDLGSFVLDADGVRWAADLGPDYYNLPEYFDAKGGTRWRYFRLNNFSHNTITPGKALQKYGSIAPITAFASTPARAFAITNLTAVYPDAATKIERGIALLDRARVLVQDEFMQSTAGTPLQWTMATEGQIELAAGGVTISREGRTLRVEVLSPANAAIRVGSALPPTEAENPNKGFSLLLVEATASGEPMTRITVLLTPVNERTAALPKPVVEPLSSWR